MQKGSVGEVFLAFFKLGLTAFGGPTAHLGYFREEFVVRRGWLDDAAYADIVALCQFLPGPSSSQVGMALGLERAGWAGMAAAFVAFTLPSAVLLLAFAYGVAVLGDLSGAGWLHGLKTGAVAIVALALWGMAKTLTPDTPRLAIGFCATALALAIPGTPGQIAAILLGALAGLTLFGAERTPAPPPAERTTALPLGRRGGAVLIGLFFVLLFALPLLATAGGPLAGLADSFYRAGALVFGGGHVVLPLLEAELPTIGVDRDAFLAGYGAAQAVPGPLFALSAFLGVLSFSGAGGLGGAALALFAIYLPSLLLVPGAMPFWNRLRAAPRARTMLTGINAAVVGLLAAAFYDPVLTAGLAGPGDFLIALGAFLLLQAGKAPPWLVMGLCALAGALLPATGL